MCFFRKIDNKIAVYCNGQNIGVGQYEKIPCETVEFLKGFYKHESRNVFINNGTDMVEMKMEIVVVDGNPL